MDRIQISAIGLAVVLIVVWFLTVPTVRPPSPSPGPAPATPEAEGVPAERPAAEPPPALPPLAEQGGAETALVDAERQKMTQEVLSVLENDAVRLRVSSRGGRVVAAELKQFADRVGSGSGPVELVTSAERGTLTTPLGGGALKGLEFANYQVQRAAPGEVVHVFTSGGVSVTRKLELDPEGYGGRLRLAFENRSGQTLSPEFSLVWYGLERPSTAPDYFMQYSLVAEADGSVVRRPLAGITSTGFLGGLFGGGPWQGATYASPVEWAGIDSRYFLVAAIPENPHEAIAIHTPLGPDAGRSALSYQAFEVPPGHRVERVYRLYFGPKVTEEVMRIDPRLDRSLEVGWTVFRPLVRLFAVLLHWTYDHVVSNYGLAIILLTILLRLATLPLTQKSMKSMKRFSVIAPEMKALQDKYKDDRDRLQQEMMALYRRKGMNPLSALGGGCIPMLIQFPFLIALYFALQSSIELRHAPFFLWITDLSAPENLFEIAGLPVRPLPLLMGASMLLQQQLTPTAGADPQQRRMMMWMSVFFIFLFYQFPSGLVLYWLVSNVLGILQQVFVNRQTADLPAKA